MERKARYAALLLLVSLVHLAAGLPVCLVPSVGDSILGRPSACWALDPAGMFRNCRIGIVELFEMCHDQAEPNTVFARIMKRSLGDEASLHRAVSIVQRNKQGYVALLFYASWCPFSKILRPDFQIVVDLFPAIHHFAFEESAIRPSTLSKYGVHGFPTLILLNSTMRVRYRGSRSVDSLVAFYNNVTGVDPSAEPRLWEEIMDPAKDNKDEEDMQENCPFSWARSPEKLLEQDGYLALAICFLLMRLVYLLLPSLLTCFQRAWRRQLRYSSLRNLWNNLQIYTKQAKRGSGGLYPCQTNLQEGAMNARAWASQSLASVSLGESSSGRSFSMN